MKLPQFRTQVDAWKEPDSRERMRYAISCLVFKDEIWLAEISGVICVAKSSDGKYVIPVWPSREDMEATFTPPKASTGARLYSQKEFETNILEQMQDDELIAVFPDQNLHYEQLDKNEMAAAIKYVEGWTQQVC